MHLAASGLTVRPLVTDNLIDEDDAMRIWHILVLMSGEIFWGAMNHSD